MFTIIKGQQPTELLQYKNTASASYADMERAVKDKVRSQLLKEQGYLCAYCMERIKNDRLSTKIEHIEPQTTSPHKALEYANMLAVCKGGEGSAPNLQHCDTFKGDKHLSFNPANPSLNLKAKIRYLGDGRMISDDTNLDTDINDILNLNVANLKNNRYSEFLGVKRGLSTLGKHANRTKILRLIAKWEQVNSRGERKPHFAAAVYFLNKRLTRCSS